MLEEMISLPNEIYDPYAISLHLQLQYEKVSKYYEKHERSDGEPFGLILAHSDNTDLVKRRYDELLDLEIPKETNTSITELMRMSPHELRHIIKRFRKRMEIRRRAQEKARAEAEKGNKSLVNKPKGK